jgi:hypothetical protein
MPTGLKRERVDGAGLLAFWGAGLLCLFFCAGAWGSQNVSLAWDAVQDPSVAGYAVYYGTVSGQYSARLDAGTNNAITIPGLTEGVTYYFVYAVYDALGEESAPSNEVAYIVPGVIFLSAGGPGGPMTITFPVAPPHWYELQATSDLQTWTTIWQTEPATDNAWVEYQDFEARRHAMRFYRLETH